MAFVSHPLIVTDTIEERAYQTNIANKCMGQNTLVILPTGLGKTIIALIIAARVLEKEKKVLILAPTKPLVEQHFESFSKLLRDIKIGTMNGLMNPSKRGTTIIENDIIVTTPQVVSNDLENGRYNLDDFGLIIFDEAHRAVGNYAYVDIAARYSHLTLAMTASPGSNINKMMEVCRNLDVRHVEMRTDDDPDVSPYVHDIYIKRVTVEMPDDLRDVIALLNKMLNSFLNELINLGFMDRNWPASTKHLLVIGNTLQTRLARGEKTAMIFRGLVAQSASIKLMHAIGLAETQGMSAIRNYMMKIDEDANKDKTAKATREIFIMPEYTELWNILKTSKVEHPKISRVMSMVSMKINSDDNTRVIVFSQYRETCDMLTEKLSRINNVRVAKLIGQSNGGLKQKEQVSLIDDFRDGKYNVLVSTSVGEEGLDIASTDLVIFYEPVPSAVRTIQRRGRTGRKNTGEVYVLITSGTRDEAYDKSTSSQEDKMKENIQKLNSLLQFKHMSVPGKQTKLI